MNGMENRDVVVITCGTSLLGHLKNRGMDPAGAAEWLGSQDPQARECGAEVNALASLLQEHETVRPRILSLHCSDTPEGRQVGELLRRALPRLFPTCEEVPCRYVADLDGACADAFRSRGLRHLAASLAGDVRAYGAERIVLNATGGFKAMVALAQALAQAAGIPAYYRFEAARGGLLIPPLPLSFDLPLWLRLSEVLRELREQGLMDREDLDPLRNPLSESDRERLRMLLEETQLTEGGRRRFLCALSALGDLFLDMGDYHFSRNPKGWLPPDAPTDQKGQECRVSASEPGAEGFENRERVGGRVLPVPYVGRCTLRYYNPDGRNLRRCHVKNPAARELEVEWGTGQALAKYIVTVPAARSLEELMAAREDLQRRIE